MLKSAMVGPNSILYKPLLIYQLIQVKIGTTTSSAQKNQGKLQQPIHALKRLLLKFHAIWTSTTTSTKMTSYMVYSNFNMFSMVKGVKQ